MADRHREADGGNEIQDPELLYSKDYCIGEVHGTLGPWAARRLTPGFAGGGSFGKVYKGCAPLSSVSLLPSPNPHTFCLAWLTRDAAGRLQRR